MANEKKHVFIVGAGFSAPAQLPIQNRILKEITRSDFTDFLSFKPEPESIKFMTSYIKVGLYLLQNYTVQEIKDDITSFDEIEKKLLYYDSSSEYGLIYRDIEKLKESIRLRLEDADLQVNLEDIFTSFDKSYIGREYINQHSYYQVGEIKDAIMRLFVFYFSKAINAHSFNFPGYMTFCDYVKKLKNVTIITTNWDVLIEEYFNREKIKYNLCFNEPYYNPCEKPNKTTREIKLIKLHGSINWFRCLHCGTLNITDNTSCGNFLFIDSADEKCSECKFATKKEKLLLPEMITPTMIKTINNQLYNNLWSAAQRQLMHASDITFIGYSLPIADFELRYLLQRSIPSQAKIDVVLHSSDNPENTTLENLKCLLPEKRYKDLLTKNRIQFFYNGFEEYFGELMHS